MRGWFCFSKKCRFLGLRAYNGCGASGNRGMGEGNSNKVISDVSGLQLKIVLGSGRWAGERGGKGKRSIQRFRGSSRHKEGSAIAVPGVNGHGTHRHSLHLPRISRKNQKKGPGIARAGIMGVAGSVGYAAFQNPISVLP